jgi:hypothetical protein
VAFDWIDAYMTETEGISPPSFCLWSAIATIAGALERRVWSYTDKGELFPNLYTILTGAPSAGKSLMVNTARNLWANIDGLHIAPDNPTKATFLDSLEGAARQSTVVVNGEQTLNSFCSMCVGSREFGVLIPKYDHQFLEDLTDLYDNPNRYTAPRRTTRSVTIEKPNVNILAATTPDFLGDMLPDVAWGQGFTSRLIFIYGIKENVADRDILSRRRNTMTGSLIDALREFFTDLSGEFEWAPEARAALNLWYNSGMPPEPEYGRLYHYKGRREVHIMKLCMVSAVAAGHGLYIAHSDWERALHWLLSAEETMPDVFRAIAMKSDGQLIDDLHYHIYTMWSRVAYKERKAIPTKVLWEYLRFRVPSERITKIIDAAEQTGAIKKGTYPGEWVPRDMTAKDGATI